jgi:hypothetical protein
MFRIQYYGCRRTARECVCATRPDETLRRRGALEKFEMKFFWWRANGEEGGWPRKTREKKGKLISQCWVRRTPWAERLDWDVVGEVRDLIGS